MPPTLPTPDRHGRRHFSRLSSLSEPRRYNDTAIVTRSFLAEKFFRQKIPYFFVARLHEDLSLPAVLSSMNQVFWPLTPPSAAYLRRRCPFAA